MSMFAEEALTRYDEAAACARKTLGGTFAMLSIFDTSRARQLIVGVDGLPPEFAGVREIPMVESYCGYVHDHGCQLIVDDVSQEHDVAAHPVAHQLGIEAYAGWHVRDSRGHTIGVLCVMEDTPRAWTTREQLQLMDLAHRAGPLLEELVGGPNGRASVA